MTKVIVTESAGGEIKAEGDPRAVAEFFAIRNQRAVRKNRYREAKKPVGGVPTVTEDSIPASRGAMLELAEGNGFVPPKPRHPLPEGSLERVVSFVNVVKGRPNFHHNLGEASIAVFGRKVSWKREDPRQGQLFNYISHAMSKMRQEIADANAGKGHWVKVYRGNTCIFKFIPNGSEGTNGT